MVDCHSPEIRLRTLHRWMMLIFGIFIAYIVVTGVSLAVVDIADSQRAWAGDGGGPGSPTPAVVDGTSGAAVPFNQAFPGGAGPSGSLHGAIKNWHRGNPPIASVLGVAIGLRLTLIVGGVMTLLALSGLYLYLTMWWKRRGMGRRGFFWRDRSIYSWLHRAVSIIAAVFILNQAVTGTLLAWFNLTDPSTQPGPPRGPSGFTEAEISSLLPEVWQRAHAAAPTAPILAVTLMRNGIEPFGPVFYGGPQAGAIGFRLNSNDYVFGTSGAAGPGGAAMDSHSLLKRIHRGDFIGSFAGRYMSLLAGLSMAWLLISGLAMYLQRLQRRAAQLRAAQSMI